MPTGCMMNKFMLVFDEVDTAESRIFDEIDSEER